ncbi:carboxylating nicotinate-nucleotide diphosphorylase [Thermomonospora catenispora]|uniref:carboxylating nicotinate-nucleotide diphosphorylase n=1 Tax=Thermomonospora catenispora TaxID=2493090 RepID=UPI00111E5348|nr:carboxylating nicotinate-nucleotide diphosphorylase [Thermomonospora catenispora]TNY35290.1 carboxylating nicotinate-nucleotide diphosphorylase [Thermomonospora catenispora]
MTPELTERLTEAGLDPRAVQDLVERALAEDGEVDVTSEPIFGPQETARGEFTARQDGVVAGLPVAAAVCQALGLRPVPHVEDGRRVVAGQVLMTVSGPTRAVLRAERVALNLLTHLSGVATETRRWVDAVAGTGAKIRDTRKTLPGLRALQKYAVRCGGGVNHRMGLHDAALIKDNHIAAAGSVTKAFQAVRAVYPSLHVQVECDTLAQVAEALEAGATSILLDNMDVERLREAVRLAAGRAELEASGGLTLDRARDVAVTGVDYLAVGALTHSARSFDIGLDFS